MTPPPPKVQRYLRRVTLLLPPTAARHVRAELHGNLYQTMLDARLNGLTEADAWAAALRQAGPAIPAAVRFARTHTLGLALRWLLAAGLLGGAAYAIQGTHPTSPTQHLAQP
ncbi:hypothetical protein HNQ07_004349 [Deinococcus metalli]|uniref:Uncharacterized protein n=1 Tax=Deinococcus metalli TaxID=1141878 RepID=A0A7W8KIP6_9DEIO|nr:hypothetical protein [Deinococcus metalli]MBB5378842.1 hypothetical protein [Deinococcus metalli]